MVGRESMNMKFFIQYYTWYFDNVVLKEYRENPMEWKRIWSKWRIRTIIVIIAIIKCSREGTLNVLCH